MMELLFGGGAALFGVTAVLGTRFFLGRVVPMLSGGLGDALHGGIDVDAGHAAGAVTDHTDSSSAFKVLSLQAIAAFLMGFGWGDPLMRNGSRGSYRRSAPRCGSFSAIPPPPTAGSWRRHPRRSPFGDRWARLIRQS
jgi:hypothetical protein